MKRIGLRIEAIDTLFFRDGRPFVASSRAESGLPTPQTLAGALRTWFLKQYDCDFELLGHSLREGVSFAEALSDQDSQPLSAIAEIKFKGPWLAHLQSHKLIPLLPVPAALRQVKNSIEIVRLSPKRELPGWSAPVSGLWPMWLNTRQQLEGLTGYLSLNGLKTFLEGDIPSIKDYFRSPDLYVFEERTGIGISSEKASSEDGLIYAVNLLRLKAGVGFYAELELPDSLAAQLPSGSWVLPFGGEGRRVIVSQTAELVSWPEVQPQAQQLQTLVLISPALVESQGQLEKWQPKAVALQPWQAVSGWDLALNGPKPLRWALPAGSVLYFDSSTTFPTLSTGEASELGWGTYLKGVSDYV